VRLARGFTPWIRRFSRDCLSLLMRAVGKTGRNLQQQFRQRMKSGYVKYSAGHPDSGTTAARGLKDGAGRRKTPRGTAAAVV
jgi:hypothetical protein